MEEVRSRLWVLVLVVIVISCTASGEEYIAKREDVSYVFGAKGHQKDYAEIAASCILRISRNGSMGGITVRVRDVDMDVRSGKSILAMEPELLQVASSIKRAGEAIQKAKLLLQRGKIVLLIGKGKIAAVCWREMEKRLFEEIERKQTTLVQAFPFLWVVQQIPFLLKVEESIRPGDEVIISFRKPLQPGHFSSSDKAVSLTCTGRHGTKLFLESDNTKQGEKMKLMWHVEVVFDLKTHMIEKAMERRFLFISDMKGNIHVVRQTVKMERRD